MKIIGHRGAAGLGLENTLEAIAAALKLPLYAIEVDVRRTKDNQLVLSHDSHTGRTADTKVRIRDLTLKELQSVKLHNGKPVATLAQALELIGTKKPIILDVKDAGLSAQLIATLDAYPDAEISLTGRRYHEMQKVFHARPQIAFFVQSFISPFEPLLAARSLDAHGISLNMWLMNPLTYLLAKRYNLTVRLYTVNHPWLVRFVRLLYPQTEIFTNHPHKYVAAKRKATKHERNI